MNRVEIIRQSTLLEREVWTFLILIDYFDSGIRLNHYEKQVKASSRHKWHTTAWWDKTDNRASNLAVAPYPIDVEDEARKEFQNMILTLPVRR